MVEYLVEWSWIISAALFFGGLAGGSYLLAFGAELLDEKKYRNFSKMGYYLAFPAVILCLILLALDLGTPSNLINIRNLSSMVVIGSGILSAFIILSLLTIIGREESIILPQFSLGKTTQRIIGGLGAIFALGTVMYTALLLAASFGRPFWGTPFLPYLFLVSGLLTGLAAIGLGLLSKEELKKTLPEYKEQITTSDISFHFLELVILALLLGTVNAPASVDTLLTGDLSIYFIGGVLLVGLFIPMILAFYSMQKKEISFSLTGLTFVLVLIGGFLLRYVIVIGGQAPPAL